MKQPRPALSKEFIRPSLRNQEINRPTGGLLMIVGAVVIGALVLQLDRPPREWVLPIIAVVLTSATIGGAIYHPIRRFWMRGACAGLLIGAISLATTFFYLKWRVGDSHFMGSEELHFLVSVELLIPSGVGALPGITVYYLMMRNETVDESK
jgi:hypothetical protein